MGADLRSGQKSQATGTGSGNKTVALPSNAVAGNAILVAIFKADSSASDPTVSDNQGNTYTKLVSKSSGSLNTVWLYGAQNVTGGAITVTVNFSGAQAYCLEVYEFENCHTTDAFHAVASANGFGGTMSAGNLVTSQSGCGFATGEGVSPAPGTGSGWTSQYTSGYAYYTRSQTKPTSSGTYAATFSTTEDYGWDAVAVHIRDAPAGGTTYDVDVSEGVKAGDTQAPATELSLAVTDGVKAGDAAAPAVEMSLAVVEGILAGDSLAGGLSFEQTITEGILAGDTGGLLLEMSLAVSEGVTVGDSTSATHELAVSLTEGIALGDGLTAALDLLAEIAEGVKCGDLTASALAAGAYILAPDRVVFWQAPNRPKLRHVAIDDTDADEWAILGGVVSWPDNKPRFKHYKVT